MEDQDIEKIKASLVEEQRLETGLKKEPDTSNGALQLLHSLYIARMNLERASWGCSVDRNRFSLLKSSLLEEAHLEELLKQEGNNGTHEGYKLDAVTSVPLKQEGNIDSDLQKLLNLARNKSSNYISELEANLDPTVPCALLPTKRTTKAIPTESKQTVSSATKEIEAPKPIRGQELLKEKEKRRQLVRYIMSSTL